MARVLSEETTLSRQRKNLARESHVLDRLVWVEALAALTLAVLGLLFWFQRGLNGFLVMAVVLAFFAVGHFLKSRENLKQVDALAAGLKGEVEVARQLADGLDNSYYVYNDITVRSGFRRAQLDHLVVGPCGVVVLETKNWRGRIVGDAREKAWQQYRFSDSAPRRLSNPLLQNQRHAQVISAFLRTSGLADVPVIPLLVFTARKTTLEIKHLDDSIVWPSDMCDHIRRLAHATAFAVDRQDAVVNRLQRFAK